MGILALLSFLVAAAAAVVAVVVAPVQIDAPNNISTSFLQNNKNNDNKTE